VERGVSEVRIRGPRVSVRSTDSPSESAADWARARSPNRSIPVGAPGFEPGTSSPPGLFSGRASIVPTWWGAAWRLEPIAARMAP
jgi:hypothetical protein